MNKKNYFLLFILIFIIIILFFSLPSSFAADPKIITKLNSAFGKIKDWIIKLATPAAAVAVGTGIFMKKFSFGDEEKIRMAKRIIRGSLFSYGFILCVDLVLALMKTLLD